MSKYRVFGSKNGINVNDSLVIEYKSSPKAVDTDAIHENIDCDDTNPVVVTSDINQPDVCRILTATVSAETVANIKAVSVVVYGTNINGDKIEETLPAFTVDTAGTVTGLKAFATVEKIVIPAMDGDTVKVCIGWGKALALPYVTKDKVKILHSYYNGNAEATVATVTLNDDVSKSLITPYNSLTDDYEFFARLVI